MIYIQFIYSCAQRHFKKGSLYVFQPQETTKTPSINLGKIVTSNVFHPCDKNFNQNKNSFLVPHNSLLLCVSADEIFICLLYHRFRKLKVSQRKRIYHIHNNNTTLVYFNAEEIFEFKFYPCSIFGSSKTDSGLQSQTLYKVSF